MTATIDATVGAALAARGVTRVAHITPARNLPGILRDHAIRSVADMQADARAMFTRNDLLRLDGHPDKVSCSLQYPNAFYLRKVTSSPGAVNYPDWVCLLLAPDIAAINGSLFCPRNAGAASGSKNPGIDGLVACYADQVVGSRGVVYRRGPTHDPRCPTDVQAEVLVPAPIPLSYAYGIVFPTEQAASSEFVRLEQLSVPIPPHLGWMIAPGMFAAGIVTDAVQTSRQIRENGWMPAMDADR